MEHSVEESLRQELEYLRGKLQDQQPTQSVEEYSKQIQSLEEDKARLEAMLSGKLLNVQPGDLLFIERTDLFTNASKWHDLAQKFRCSLVPAHSIEVIANLDDETLLKMKLKKIKPVKVYNHLDEVMHELYTMLEIYKSLQHTEHVNLIKGCMDKVYEAMEVVKLLPGGDSDGSTREVQTEAAK